MTHRFFRASDSVYEAMRAAVDAAWGYPTAHTITCVPPAAEQWHDAEHPVITPAVWCGVASAWPPTESPVVGWFFALPNPIPTGTPDGMSPGYGVQWDGTQWVRVGSVRAVIALTTEWLSWEPVPTMFDAALAAGQVEEIDEATFWGAAPKLER